MLNLFGRNKSSDLRQDVPSTQSVESKSKYSIQLDSNGKILFISFGLKEYFLIYDIYDATQVLPDNVAQICQSLSKSAESQVIRCELNDKIWVWELSTQSKNTVFVELLNANDFENIDRTSSGEDVDQLNEELFGSIPASICVTTYESFEVVYTNKKFIEMFSLENKKMQEISELIKNEAVLQDIKASINDADQVDNVLFVFAKSGESFWQNSNLYISINIKRSKKIFGDALVWRFEDVTELKTLQYKHKQYKRKFDTAIQAATEGIWEWSKLKDDGDWWSNPMYSLLGLDNDNSKPSFELIKRLMHPKEKKIFDRLVESEIRNKQFFSMECRLTVKEKGFRWFRLRVVGSFDSSGDLNKMIGSLVNIHAEKTNRIQLQQEKDKAIATLNSIVDAVITTNAEGVVEYENAAAERLTGVSREDTRGKSIEKVISFFKEHSMNDIDNPVLTCLKTGERMNQKIYADMLDKDGTRYTVQVMAAPLVRKDGQIFGAVLVLNDVTNIRILSRRLKYQASHDILTKLINRSEFEKRVNNAITIAQNYEGNSAVLYIDLDRFKLINDICGHAAGDELLKQVAKLLRTIVNKKNSVARMGGDEFAVLIEDTNIVSAEKVAEKILTDLAAYRFSWDEKTFSIECSIGMAEIQSSCDGLTYILNAVDSACYLAKESGRNCIRKYCDGDDTIIERKGQERWIQHFDKAIESDGLVLYAQPIVSLAKDKPKKTSIEVLVRMLDEDGSIIPPNAFLPAVERYDRAYKLDRWIIEKVFQYISENKNKVKELTKISINLSGQSVAEDELLSFIQDKSREYKIDSTKICFEITETAAIANLTTAIDLIEQLKDDGFLFALDDFGSGLSSFAYLKTLPVDFLKIDGIFVKDMQTDKVNYAMVKAIHEMSAVLDKQTIAEYVENEAVVELLTEIGVDYGQGFHLGKPEPIENYLVNKSFLKKISNSAA
ncbi:MAG: EAL domain-containing protein [Gammaproteobacteria bacterium]|nr:EAL domain-containing protein [Gammaproteobacteria bacterium]